MTSMQQQSQIKMSQQITVNAKNLWK